MSMKNSVIEMKEEVEELRKEYNENTLAMDLLADKKRTIRILGIIIILLIIAFVGTNIYWINKVMDLEVVTTETEQVIEDVDNSSNSIYTQNMN